MLKDGVDASVMTSLSIRLTDLLSGVDLMNVDPSTIEGKGGLIYDTIIIHI